MDLFDLRNWEGLAAAGGSLAEPVLVDQIVIDSRRISTGDTLFVALRGDKSDGHEYVRHAAQAGAKYALVSTDWQCSQGDPNLILLRVPDTLKAFQAIAKAYRFTLPSKIIGITGSFGKTMVKDLLYPLLSTQKTTAASPESFNSQIGVPLSLLTIRQHHEIAIIEAAISQKGEMDALADIIAPDYTILTPIGKKHLATLGNLATLTAETLKLVSKTSRDGWSLLPRDVNVEAGLPIISCPYFFWNELHPNLPHASDFQFHADAKYCLNFPDHQSYQGTIKVGYAYYLNLINMSVKAAWLLGIPSSEIISVLQNYKLEPTRAEIFRSSQGAIFVNETYCSDPQSIDHVLRHFDHATANSRKIFVFGGMRGNAIPQSDYRRIGKALAQSAVDQLLLVGPKPFKPLIEEVEQHSKKTEIIAFDDYQETFNYLIHDLKGHDLVIFKGENKLPHDVLVQCFNDSLAHNQCIINLAAIKSNLALIRKKLPDHTRVMVMVKALAYGTDDVRIAKFLSTCGVDILGVSYIDEGIALKQAGVHQAIFSINAAPYEVVKVVKWELEVGVSDSFFIASLAEEAAKKNKKIKVHLHINTGMGRFGCRPEDALSLARQVLASPSLELEGIMTHFACADNPEEDDFTWNQVACFDRVVQELAEQKIECKWKHAANSSAALRFNLPQYNMVRLGLSVYGLYPSEAVRHVVDLHLAISLTSRIVGINECKKDDTISYGRKYRVERDTQKIAVLPIGYFDGLHRNYSGKGHVLIRGQKSPMIGNICMDYLMVDVTDIPNISVGDKVLIFGEDEFGYYLSPEELANTGDSIIYELITCLGPRIQRIFVYEESKQFR